MFLIESIEQRPLHLLARAVVILALKPRFQRLAQIGDAVEPKALGKFVVDLGGLGLRDFFNCHLETGGLAGQFGLGIRFWEGRGNRPFLAGLGAGQALFETGNEAASADHDRSVLALATVEFNPIHGAGEINGDTVTLGGSPVRDGFIGRRPGDQIGQALVNIGFSDF